jgi:hypothetical protein
MDFSCQKNISINCTRYNISVPCTHLHNALGCISGTTQTHTIFINSSIEGLTLLIWYSLGAPEAIRMLEQNPNIWLETVSIFLQFALCIKKPAAELPAYNTLTRMHTLSAASLLSLGVRYACPDLIRRGALRAHTLFEELPDFVVLTEQNRAFGNVMASIKLLGPEMEFQFMVKYITALETIRWTTTRTAFTLLSQPLPSLPTHAVPAVPVAPAVPAAPAALPTHAVPVAPAALPSLLPMQSPLPQPCYCSKSCGRGTATGGKNNPICLN